MRRKSCREVLKGGLAVAASAGVGSAALAKIATVAEVDPALLASHEHKKWFDALNAALQASKTMEDDYRPEAVMASDTHGAAADKFADKIPTTNEGDIAKLEEVLDLIHYSSDWEYRHAETVIAYLKGAG